MFAFKKAAKAATVATLRRNMASARVLVHDAKFIPMSVENYINSEKSFAKNFKDRFEYVVRYDHSTMTAEFPQPTGLALRLHEKKVAGDEHHHEANDFKDGMTLYVVSLLAFLACEYYMIGWQYIDAETDDNFAEVDRKEKIFATSIGKRYQDIE